MALTHIGLTHLSVPRMARRRASRGHLGEDVRLAERSESLLPLGLRVGPDGATKHPLCEQDERGAERLSVELVREGEVGQISAVSDK